MPLAFEDLIYSSYRIFKSAIVLLCCFNFLFPIDLVRIKAALFKLCDEFKFNLSTRFGSFALLKKVKPNKNKNKSSYIR